MLIDKNDKETREWLTSCYNQANDITVKNPPLSTDRIFAAMLYMYELGKKETQNSEGL
jgi:hypothetical protein